jgi:hypothetical protein
MFQGLIRSAQRTVDSTLAKLLTRAAVAVPLLVAASFATAALTVTLSQAYGPVTSYTVMAGVFALIGGIIAAVVATNGPAETPEPAEETPTVAEVAAPFLDKDVLLATLTTVGPVALPGVLRAAARNLPLVVAAILVAIFLLGQSSPEGDSNEAGETGPPDGTEPQPQTPAT